eukprot:CAMPEP_0117009838 /NCGR_PEP_ID=MMETSP0472-20121206/8830_1 /TAXON_ID=693140 ORGANISM="Tiarina fusus, Strain LIS" /NCGR_SAMPLE_ID=MMETSP0472 /ASSEMBLY_ACC=CAM_ASM_000603 /LENGTH=476 /DNA_ID=CAMNT_0004712231 /DNA_START=89 /DNA_END=1519 /DNA_ORIENTATION=+
MNQTRFLEPFQAFSAGPGIIVDDITKASVSCCSQRYGSPDCEKNTLISDTSRSTKLGQLSMQERSLGIHELHGVADVEVETPELLKEKLDETSRIADSFENDDRLTPYRSAIKTNQEYVDRIKLLCLRADYHDCEKAAARLVSFFAFKKAIFGDKKLTREITMDDIETDEKRAIEDGLCQLLPGKDRAGRAVLVADGKMSSETGVDQVCRAIYYVLMAAIRDEEVQKKGIVFVLNMIGQTKFHSDRPSKLASLFSLFPARLAAVHLCYDHSILGVAVNMVAESMNAHYLCRFRSHYGSRMECLFQLMTFGIPKDVWPFNMESDEPDLEAHHRWLKALRAREKKSQVSTAIGESLSTKPSGNGGDVAAPGPMDIVMGRGRHAKTSIGYLRFRDLVEKYRGEYDNSERFEKVVVANIVFRELRRQGCRFVKNTAHGVQVQSDLVAMEKISHAFRNIRLIKTSRRGRKSVARSVAFPKS